MKYIYLEYDKEFETTHEVDESIVKIMLKNRVGNPMTLDDLHKGAMLVTTKKVYSAKLIED